VNAGSLDRVQTAHLTCERLRPDHLAEVLILLRDPRVARTLCPAGEPPTEAEVIVSLGDKLAHWDRHGFGIWQLYDRASGTMVGRSGLQHTFVAGANEVEVGWAIVPERWGEGLATELARAAVDVAFRDLGLTDVVAFTLPDNLASRRVMEKTGFSLEREIVHAELPHVLYRRQNGRE
jgi:[ribosomal protein S5]-alanine N-acetyltransferase